MHLNISDTKISLWTLSWTKKASRRRTLHSPVANLIYYSRKWSEDHWLSTVYELRHGRDHILLATQLELNSNLIILV